MKDFKKIKKKPMAFQSGNFTLLNKKEFAIFFNFFKKKIEKIKKSCKKNLFFKISYELFKNKFGIRKNLEKKQLLKIFKKKKKESFFKGQNGAKIKILKNIKKKYPHARIDLFKKKKKSENERKVRLLRIFKKVKFQNFSVRFHGAKTKMKNNEKKILFRDFII